MLELLEPADPVRGILLPCTSSLEDRPELHVAACFTIETVVLLNSSTSLSKR